MIAALGFAFGATILWKLRYDEPVSFGYMVLLFLATLIVALGIEILWRGLIRKRREKDLDRHLRRLQ